MQTVVFRGIALVMALFFSACGPKLSVEARKHLEFESRSVKKLVKDFKMRTNANGILEVEMIFASPKETKVFYKVDWLDSEGFILQDAINGDYRLLWIPKKEEVVVRKTSPSLYAKDFKSKIKE